MKKIIITLTILSILNFIGCYSYKEITKDEFISSEEKLDLHVKTKNQYLYRFHEGDYSANKDSIYGSGKFLDTKLIQAKYNNFSGSIQLEDIETLKFDEFDATLTILSVTVVVGLVVLGLANCCH